MCLQKSQREPDQTSVGINFARQNQEVSTVANKEQKKTQKAAPKSNKQKKQMQKEKKAAKVNPGSIILKKE
jgi:hypothetical protein